MIFIAEDARFTKTMIVMLGTGLYLAVRQCVQRYYVSLYLVVRKCSVQYSRQ